MTHEIIKPNFTREDERGTLRELLNGGEWRSVIQGEMKVGAVMGNHYHQNTLVFFFLLSGAADIVTEHTESKERDSFSLGAMEGVMLKTGESHAITFREQGQYLLLKSLPYDPANPDTFHYPV
jgi:mannose-6-phosphate isomerase-like protein (cupin superfamily)